MYYLYKDQRNSNTQIIPTFNSINAYRQILLSKATLMLYLSQKIHSTVQNTESGDQVNNSQIKMSEKDSTRKIHNGNKIATLVGDLFITEM